MGNQHTIQISTLKNGSAAFGTAGTLNSRQQLPRLDTKRAMSMMSAGDTGSKRPQIPQVFNNGVRVKNPRNVEPLTENFGTSVPAA